MPMSFTVPVAAGESTKLPTLKGLHTMIIIPLAILDRPPWRARPMATPQEPMRATMEASGTPRIMTAMSMISTLSAAPTKLVRKDWAVGSAFWNSFVFCSSIVRYLTRRKPRPTTAPAISSFSPKFGRVLVKKLLNHCAKI